MKLFRPFVALLLGCFTFSANAQDNVLETDEYVVYYNAFNSSFLSPEVAKRYNIRRSDQLGLLNVTVQKKAEDALKPVHANIMGVAKNRLSQMRELSFKEIRDGEAIYYLASFPMNNEETLTFNLEIQGEGEGEREDIRFSQQFFVK